MLFINVIHIYYINIILLKSNSKIFYADIFMYDVTYQTIKSYTFESNYLLK